MVKASFSDKVAVLADLYLAPEWSDFLYQHNISIPAAWLIQENLVRPTAMLEKYIDQTYETLLVICPIDDDGFPLTNRE